MNFPSELNGNVYTRVKQNYRNGLGAVIGIGTIENIIGREFPVDINQRVELQFGSCVSRGFGHTGTRIMRVEWRVCARSSARLHGDNEIASDDWSAKIESNDGGSTVCGERRVEWQYGRSASGESLERVYHGCFWHARPNRTNLPITG